MRVTVKYILLLLLLVSLGACSTGKVIPRGMMKKAAKEAIPMLPALDHDWTVSVSTELGAFLCKDLILVPCDQLVSKNFGAFVLDKNLEIKSFEINGRFRPLVEVIDYSPDNFKNLRPFQSAAIKRDGRLYEFAFDPKDIEGDSVALTVRYVFYPKPNAANGTISATKFSLNGDSFLFPTALNQNDKLTLRLITPKTMTVLVNNSEPQFVEDLVYRHYSCSFNGEFQPIKIQGTIKR